MEDEQVVETTEGEPSETTEEVETAEVSEEQEEAPAEPAADPEKEKKGIQKRFDQITKEKHEARAEAEYWRKVATGEITPQAAPEPQKAVDASVKPTVEQFETYEDFVEALTDWKVEQKEASKAVATKQKTVEESHTARVETAKGQYTDFDEVTSSLDGIMVPNVTIEAIKESDLSADLFYYLGQNPDEAKKLQGMSVTAQLKEIGRMESRLEKKPVPVNRISKAPTPIRPVGATGEVVSKNPDKMTAEEWIEYERGRVAKLGRRY